MGVICFSSLKGGVGKTTLTVNLAAAFAARGCQTLMIDLDPAGHASSLFGFEVSSASERHESVNELASGEAYTAPSFGNAVESSSLSHLVFRLDCELDTQGLRKKVQADLDENRLLQKQVRNRLSLVPATADLRHFLWGKGARLFRKVFPVILAELNEAYDYVLIDTPPDFNVLVRNAIAQADLVVVPVDPSAMSIRCLEQLIADCEHIKRPTWAIARTMINRQAKRLQKCAAERLNLNLQLANSESSDSEPEDDFDLTNPEEFISFLEERETRDQPQKPTSASPIYLLNGMTYRTEQQNHLTFLRKTCFDQKNHAALAAQYLSLVKELEQILAIGEELPELPDLGTGFGEGLAARA